MEPVKRPREAAPLALFLGSAGLVLFFAWLARAVASQGTMSFDRAVFLFFREAGNPAVTIGPAWLKEGARDLTALGSTLVLGLMLVSVLGFLLITRKRGTALLVLAAVVGGQALSTVLKYFFERARPDLVPDAPQVFTASFPSGHAMLSAVTYLTLGALLARVQPSRAGRLYFVALAIGLTMLIGASRVYLGVHWPTDVLAGWCVGAAWAMMCWLVAVRLQARGEIEPAGSSEGLQAPEPPSRTR